MTWKTHGKSGGYHRFEEKQQTYADGVAVLLTEGLNPARSGEYREFVLDKTVISESVEAPQGDEQDKASTAVRLCQGVREYRQIYGRDPEPGQMAAVGASLKAFPAISEDFTARPQFMVLSALLPLKTIAGQLGYSVGFVPGDELAIYEVDKQGDRYQI